MLCNVQYNVQYMQYIFYGTQDHVQGCPKERILEPQGDTVPFRTALSITSRTGMNLSSSPMILVPTA